MRRKYFNTLYEAESFNKKVNGKIIEEVLPDYNGVEIVYIVEY